MLSPYFIKTAFMSRILTLLFVLCLAPTAFAQTPATLAEQPIANEGTTDEKLIQFSFDKADWKDVVPWFAEQTGYSWQPISDWPEGTFTFSNEQKYSPKEALDQLNYALRLRKPAYTIIRNRNQLILTDASRPLPNELIETVTPAELDQRGDYEIVRCKFSLGSIDVNTVQQDLRSSISPQYQNFIKVLPSTNDFIARETGGNLRKVRDAILEITRRKAIVSFYLLKHYDPEQFLIVSRPLLGIAEGGDRRDDGSLIISIDPSTDRFILRGTPSAINEFKELAAVVDTAVDEEETNTERPYLKSYPVVTDPEVARKVVETMLDGTDATIGQDETTGAIILNGRKEHHQRASDTLATLRGEVGTTKIVRLEYSSASTILSAVQSLMGSAASGVENPSGPKLLANTVQNYIVIRGTPSEIFQISEMIIQLDQEQRLDPNRERTNVRVVKVPKAKRDNLIEDLQDYMDSAGLKNRIRVIKPKEDREKANGGLRRFKSPGSGSKELQRSEEMRTPQSTTSGGTNDTRTSRTASQRSALAAPSLLNFALTSLVAYQPQDEAENSEEPVSIPGSPITIKATSFGILLESDDLDALDDLEALLAAEATTEGTDQGLTVFYLKYQKAASIKATFDEMFGLGGGGSGGGGGGLLEGIVDNVAGEAAGELAGGLLGGLGGGASSGSAVVSLEGDVQIGMYAPQNLLFLSGATESDLEIIQDAIDIFDQPSPPHNPELAGQSYVIPIQHRDPEEVYELVRKQLAAYFEPEQVQRQQQEGGGNAPEQVAKAMRNAIGGGRRGGGGQANTEQDFPKAQLDLDKPTSQILLTGPEFIYKQVKNFVERIDTPQLETTKGQRVLSSGITEGMLKIIRERFGGSIEMVDDSDDADAEAAKANGNQGSANGNNRAGQNTASRDEAQRQERAELFRTIRNQAQQRGGRGQRGGGGGQRGGGRGGQQRGGGR